MDRAVHIHEAGESILKPSCQLTTVFHRPPASTFRHLTSQRKVRKHSLTWLLHRVHRAMALPLRGGHDSSSKFLKPHGARASSLTVLVTASFKQIRITINIIVTTPLLGLARSFPLCPPEWTCSVECKTAHELSCIVGNTHIVGGSAVITQKALGDTPPRAMADSWSSTSAGSWLWALSLHA